MPNKRTSAVKGSSAKEETETAINRTKAEWNEIAEAYRKSGQTMTAFCDGRGISTKTLRSHLNNPGNRETEKRSQQEWNTLLEEQKASGLPLARWCREHGVGESALRSAERRQSAFRRDTGPKWIGIQSGIKPATAAEKAAVTESGGKIKIYGRGFEIEADAGYPVEKLAVFVGGLMKPC